MFSISPNCYNLLRCCLNLPCETTIRNHFQDKIKKETENLLDMNNLPEILHNYREQHEINEVIDIVLGVDAFSFDRLTDEGSKFAFCFLAQPINPKLPCFPIYLVPTIDGKASFSIIAQMKCLITILEENGAKDICTSSDGDSAYNILSEETFEVFMEEGFKGGFEAAMQAWDNFKGDKHICDMLHCIKLARFRFLFGNITLNCDKTDHLINAKKLESILYLGPILTDDSSVGKMKDYYALKLFCLDNLEKLFEKDYIYELVYFIPFTCWAEAITNQNINRLAFWIFWHLYMTKIRMFL